MKKILCILVSVLLLSSWVVIAPD
ncbi:MAG: lipoprotein, partial [Bacteroidetes bacterium]|nr:lipoprotein [Bacteroidota bacterium]